jgi:Holliday junction resolvase RusA-like endonuclease
VIEFFVPGLPAPAGSKRAYVNKTTLRVNVVDDSGKRGRRWRKAVALAAGVECGLPEPLAGPLVLTLEFRLPRPRSHYGTGRNHARLKPDAPEWPTVKPDALKLARSVEDSLTGVVYRDDAQVVVGTQAKRYTLFGEAPGVLVRVAPAGEGAAP